MQSVSSVFSYGSDFRAVDFPTFRKFFVSAHDHFIPHPRNNYHPHILSHRMLALLSLLIMTVKIVGISLVIVSPATISEASEITSPTIISLANSARTDGGLSALTSNGMLSRAAQNKADDMLAKQYFSHNTPSGDTPWTFIKATGYNYITAGENLAIDFTEAESVQTAWMNSPGHRANIMNKAFQEIGIGISRGMFNGHQTTIVVQMFGTPIAQQVTLPSKPTTVAKPASTPVAKPVVSAPSPASAPAQVTHSDPSAAPALRAVPISNTFTAPQTTSVGTQPLEIKSTQSSLQGNQLYLTVTASSDATKLLASFGKGTVMLDPAANNQWYGYISLSSLTADTNLTVYAYDINGNLTHSAVGQFSPSVNNVLKHGVVEGASISLFGKTINSQIWQEKIFLIIIASLIACLILAIAIRRHVQHVGLVANTAFVVMLAAFMLIV